MRSQPIGTFGPVVERLIFRFSPAIVILVQLALVVASYVISFFLRLDLDIGQVPWDLVLKTLEEYQGARQPMGVIDGRTLLV